ncbi:hypothetical protein M758_3G122700 [Ceratodon purpureus]|uniref:DUF7748 domain-containing protein n=1 Tax=Ceratodon purpureus TaxID=3225 RepID=A0A8T0IHI5_CERPU|nr:hypothetical protein KC19_3G121200 [Ceratodon purpureus]KAG0622782.1 hypothetical protein M758_3G122700 [Ceratodon purpureus]
MATKVATVIANGTGQGLTMKVGNRNCFVKLASVEEGGEYTMRLCVDWTYQEFLLEDNRNTGKKLFVNSDDCCDYERITVKESDGVFVVETVPRKQFVSETEESDAVQKKPEKSSWKFWM